MDPQGKPSSPPPPYELHDPLRWRTVASPSSPSPRLPYIRLPQRTPVSQAQRQQQDESHPSADHGNDNGGNWRSRSSSLELQVDDLDAALAVLVEERERHAQQVLRQFSSVIALVVVAGISLYIGWWMVVLYAKARMGMAGPG
ncbi:hypothetical protein M432DRAFT_641496 [Thermoascus aurantiacus ATCC 26904]